MQRSVKVRIGKGRDGTENWRESWPRKPVKGHDSSYNLVNKETLGPVEDNQQHHQKNDRGLANCGQFVCHRKQIDVVQTVVKYKQQRKDPSQPEKGPHHFGKETREFAIVGGFESVVRNDGARDEGRKVENVREVVENLLHSQRQPRFKAETVAAENEHNDHRHGQESK